MSFGSSANQVSQHSENQAQGGYAPRFYPQKSALFVYSVGFGMWARPPKVSKFSSCNLRLFRRWRIVKISHFISDKSSKNRTDLSKWDRQKMLEFMVYNCNSNYLNLVAHTYF